MKNTFMDGIRYNGYGPETYGPQVRKLRQDFYELIAVNVPEADAEAYVRRLMEQPRYFGTEKKLLLWAMGEPSDMPSDAREEFIYQPTYLATGIIVYAIQHYDAVRNIPNRFPFLHDALDGCLGRGFGGHGYDFVEGLIDTMNIFADCGMGTFLETYPDLNAEFKDAFGQTVQYIEEELCTGKARNEWNNASYVSAAFPLLEKLKPSVQKQALFVYGTLMHSGRAEDLLSGCSFLGKAILKDYAMFDLGSFPGIVSKKGEWTEGELYFTHGSSFRRLDRYEGEGSLYRRELVTVESSFGPKQAWAYIYLDKPEGSPMREPWIADDEDVVWYAVYGSNLSKKRFLHYIEGGYFEADGRPYTGCTKKQLVSDRGFRAWFPGQMYFGNKSSRWNHKGVAFYDPDASGKTFMRLYKVTRQQLMEIQVQEGPSAKWYGKIQALGIHADGCPIYTLTSEYRHPVNAPDENYISLIKNALTEENGFIKSEANRYLAECLKN